MNNTIEINNTDYTGDFLGLNDLVLEYINTNGGYAVGVGGSNNSTLTEDVVIESKGKMRVIGAAYEYIIEQVKENCISELDCKISIPCCDLVDLDFYLPTSEIEFCPDECYLNCEIQAKDRAKEIFDCLNDTRLVTIQEAIDNNFVGGHFSYGSVDGAFQNREERRLYSILSYIEHAALECGFSFDTNILEGVYQDLIFICLNPSVGIPFDNGNVVHVNQNTLSILEQLEILSAHFNGGFKINGDTNTLEFKTIDEINKVDTILFNVHEASRSGCLDKPFCLNVSDDSFCSYFRGVYMSEPTDSAPDAELYASMNNLVSWQSDPPNPNLSGDCAVDSDISLTQTDDGLPVIEPFTNANYTESTCRLWLPETLQDAPLESTINNSPLSFDDTLAENLYTNFWEVNKPEEGSCVWELPSDIAIAPDNFCEMVKLIIDQGTNVGIESDFGTIISKKIEIDFKKSVLTFKDSFIYNYNS